MLQVSSQAEMGFVMPDKEGSGGLQQSKLPLLATFTQGV